MLARYVVELTFADVSERVIDLEPLLWGPMFEPLLADYELFRQVTAGECLLHGPQATLLLPPVLEDGVVRLSGGRGAI